MSIIPMFAVMIALGALWQLGVLVAAAIVAAGPALWAVMALTGLAVVVGHFQVADFADLDPEDDYPLIGRWEPPSIHY